MDKNCSIIYITGAGPGDPGLLTLKAKEIIEKSDVIVYDTLVSDEILELALHLNPNVKLIYVGKKAYEGEKNILQEDLHELLFKLSKEYKTICRLKGGDPSVFGRLGEEGEFLKKHNINFEIIPGVTSIVGASAYAGIPITHRDLTSSFTVLAAYEDPEDKNSKINWNDPNILQGTLVLLMGTKNLSKIVNKLLQLGKNKNTPMAIVHWGTTSNQETFITTLENATSDLEKYLIKPPSLIIIGDVVNYREILNWYETKPLFKKKVLITRDREKSYGFRNALQKQGAKVITFPMATYSLNESEIYNKKIINNISMYDWIFFTSSNAVKFFFDILHKNSLDSRVFGKTQIATVGTSTKNELEKYGIKVDFVPKKFSFNSLLSELSEVVDLKNKSILYPAQEDLNREFNLLKIDMWEIYKANFTLEINEQNLNQIKSGIDIITFFSSNSVKHFSTIVHKYNLHEHISNSKIAVIGEETANSTKELFGRVDIIAEPFTEEGMISSVEKYFLEKETGVLCK